MDGLDVQVIVDLSIDTRIASYNFCEGYLLRAITLLTMPLPCL